MARAAVATGRRAAIGGEPPRSGCLRCGAPLSGRQTRYCSRACKAVHWDELHPRVTREPKRTARPVDRRRRDGHRLNVGLAARSAAIVVAQARGCKPSEAAAELILAAYRSMEWFPRKDQAPVVGA
jgi:hypothetical protein